MLKKEIDLLRKNFLRDNLGSKLVPPKGNPRNIKMLDHIKNFCNPSIKKSPYYNGGAPPCGEKKKLFNCSKKGTGGQGGSKVGSSNDDQSVKGQFEVSRIITGIKGCPVDRGSSIFNSDHGASVHSKERMDPPLYLEEYDRGFMKSDSRYGGLTSHDRSPSVEFMMEEQGKRTGSSRIFLVNLKVMI
jgi:hypothetical protein